MEIKQRDTEQIVQANSRAQDIIKNGQKVKLMESSVSDPSIIKDLTRSIFSQSK